MFCLKPLKTCKEFVNKLQLSFFQAYGGRLTVAHNLYISTCLTGIILTNSVCWARFERFSFGRFCATNMAKMFRRIPINWNKLLQAGVLCVLKSYGITKGVAVLDDTDNKRSKNTNKISKVHKIKDKATGGFVNGQEILILLLVTDKLTIPVGFGFYEPDPEVKAWKKQDKILRGKGIAKKDRPAKPERNSNYPTKYEIGLELLRNFKKYHPEVEVQAIQVLPHSDYPKTPVPLR